MRPNTAKVAVTTTRRPALKSALLERQLYVNRVNLALREVNANEINGAMSLLAACPAALRGWMGLRSRPLPSGGPHPRPGLRAELAGVTREPLAGRRPQPHGRRLGAAVDRDVTIYDTATGRVILNLPHAHDGIIFSMMYSPDGLTLASGGSDSAVRLWEARTGKSLGTLGSHRSWVYSLAFSPVGPSCFPVRGPTPWPRTGPPR